MSMDANTPPRVAVIIPAFNREDLLRETLDSVLAQTYRDWEAIVIDDASSDGTYAVAQEYERADPDRVRALRLEQNQGIAGARMAGMAAARGGDLLCLLDSDDYWKPTYLEHSVALYDRSRADGRKVGLISCNPLILTPEGISGETWFDRIGYPEQVDLDVMIRRNYVHARAVISREAWEAAGGVFAPECRGSDDYDLWLRILELGYEVVTFEEPLVVYRDHEGADSHDHGSRAEGKLAAYDRALDRGALTPAQRRAVRAQIRHFRALRDRELVYRAVVSRRPFEAIRRALIALPTGAVAFLQDRSRWREWMHDLRRPAGNLRRVKSLLERSEG